MASNTYEVKFGGVTLTTTVADKSWMIDSFMSNVGIHSRPAVVGLDIEWAPNTVIGYTNRVATLQLCFGTRCLIIQLLHLDQIPSSLKTFMLDQNICFVGVGIGEDLSKLGRDYELQCRNWKELGTLADQVYGRHNFSGFGLGDLARTIVGLDMLKPASVTRSDWAVGNLSGEQIKYAAMDAYASYEIGKKLMGVNYLIELNQPIWIEYMGRPALLNKMVGFGYYVCGSFVDHSVFLAFHHGFCTYMCLISDIL